MNEITKVIDKIYLQMFTDEDGTEGGQAKSEGSQAGATDQNGTNEQDADDKGQGAAEKTFSQKDVDDIVQKRLSREKKKLEKSFQDSDDYKGYQEYKKNQQTADEKRQAELQEIENVRKENEMLQSQMKDIENGKLLDSEVDPKFKDFAMFEIKKLMTDDVDFGDALKLFKENKDYSYTLKNPNSKDTNFSQNPSSGNRSARVNNILNSVGMGHAANKGGKQ